MAAQRLPFHLKNWHKVVDYGNPDLHERKKKQNHEGIFGKVCTDRTKVPGNYSCLQQIPIHQITQF